MLKSIALRNILSFGPEGMELQLNPVNILIGPNGCGKSNLIDCISVLQNAPLDVLEPIRQSGGYEEWTNKTALNAKGMEIATLLTPKFSKLEISHRLFIHTDLEQILHEVSEEIDSGIIGEAPQQVFKSSASSILVEGVDVKLNKFDHSRSAITQLAGREDTSELSDLSDFYADIRIYRNWNFGRLHALRTAQSTSQKNKFVDEDYRNLGLILNRFKLAPQVRRKLIEELQRFAPSVTGFETLIQSGTVQIFLEEGQWPTPAIRLSDGTLRYLALLAILCDPTPPPLICIEEPELGIHPDIIPELARLIQEASARCQLIVTTHSQTLVDAFSEQPEVIVVCERDETGTQMTRLDRDEMQVWLKRYSLGQLWSKGQIGGNRW